MKALKALTVDFEPIEQSMRDLSREYNDYYLNRMTGRVVGISRALIRALAEGHRDDEGVLPKWESSMIPVARQIVLDGASEYLRIPEAFGRPHHEWRLKFIAEVRPEKFRHRLIIALRGRGSGQRFLDILKEHPEDIRRWKTYCTNCWKEKIQAWLESHGILAVERRPKKKTSPR